MSSNRYTPGIYPWDAAGICDRCGRKNLLSHMKLRKDMMNVCYPQCWTHTKDELFLPWPVFPKEGAAKPNARPEGPDEYMDNTTTDYSGFPITPNIDITS